MSLEAVPLGNIGAEVRGFDLCKPISDQIREELASLWNEHGLLLFRGQDVNPERQIAFSRIFGELEMHPLKANTSDEYPELFELATTPEKGDYMAAEYHGRKLVGRLDWHMDLHYTGRPNRGALLRAVIVPATDGMTGFADLAMAFETLDEATQNLLTKIEVAYCFSAQRRHMRYVDLDGYKPGPNSPRIPSDFNSPNFPDVAYPAVVTHPITGRRVLEITEQFLDRIVAPHRASLCNDEAIELLEKLVAHTRDPQFHYFHPWQQGDMVLWDNWRIAHCATGTPPGIDRLIHRTTIAGDATLGRVLETS